MDFLDSIENGLNGGSQELPRGPFFQVRFFSPRRDWTVRRLFSSQFDAEKYAKFVLERDPRLSYSVFPEPRTLFDGL